jgi:hypothetical protein
MRAGDRVLVAEELGFLPEELRRLCGDVVVQTQRLPVPAGDYDWVVLGDLDPTRFTSPWTTALADRPEAMTTGRLLLSYNTALRRSQPLEQVWHKNAATIRIFGPARGVPLPNPRGCRMHA